MTGSWSQITRGEIGVTAPVTVPMGEGKRVDGVVDALWIPARELQTFSGEVRVRVQVAPEHGTWWIGPHNLVERR